MRGHNKEKRKRCSTVDRSFTDQNTSTQHAELLDEIRSVKTELSSEIKVATATLEQKIESAKLEFETKITALSQSVDSRLAEASIATMSKFDELSNFVNNEMLRMSASIDTKILDATKNSAAHPVKTFENRLDRLERSEFLADLIVVGIPDVETTSLNAIIPKICSKIGYSYDLNSIIAAYRQPPKKSTNNKNLIAESRDVPIILKFRDFDCKQSFFSLYLKSKLNLKDLGLLNSKRVFINEKLTYKNKEIYLRGRELKREGKLYNYFTFRGLVFVRVKELDRSVCVSSLDHLNSLIA